MIRPGIRRLFRLWLRRADLAVTDVDEEIRFHLDQRAAQLSREGLSPERARAEALRRFGIPHGARRDLHQSAIQREGAMSLRERWYEVLLDLRLAARGLVKDGLFTGFIVTTLALGIGANAIMYGVVDRLLLRGPSHVNASRDIGHVQLALRPPDAPERVRQVFSYVLYDHLRTGARSFDGIAGYSSADPVIGHGEDARQVPARYITASFFPLLGTRTAFGRFFTSTEDTTAGAARVVVIGHALWQTRFGGESSVLGHDLVIDGQPHTIIGVAPNGFTGVGLSRVDLWLPLSLSGPAIRSDWTTTWNASWMSAIVRLKPGLTVEQASAEATAAHRASYTGRSAVTAAGEIRLAPLHMQGTEQMPAEASISRWLVGVAAVVLVIACLNVTNLLLARAARGRRDMAVRIALGSGHWRVTRAVLAEGALLAFAGCGAGLLVAHWGGVLVRRVLLPQVDWSEPVVSLRVLGISAVVTVAVGIAVSLAPAWQTLRANVIAALKQGERESAGRRVRLRRALTVAQAAFSVVLLVGAGLFVTSLWKVRTLDLGIEPDRVLTVWLEWGMADATLPNPSPDAAASARREAEEVRRKALYLEALRQVRRRPQVESASLTIGLPFSTSFGGILVRVPGLDSVPPIDGPYAAAVADDYFATVGTRILRGRPFGAADRAGSERVAVVNETLAAAFWPGEEPLGKCLVLWSDTLPCTRVVGIAANTRRFRLQENQVAQMYVPFGQEINVGGTQLVVRPRGSPEDFVEPLRRQLHAMDPSLMYTEIGVLGTRLDAQYRPWRLGASVFAMCGALALIIAAVGLYSVLTYLVTQRTREIGVRLAVGARTGDVTRLILKSGLGMVSVGIAVGLVVALAAGRFIQGMLFETSARDPRVLAGVALTMLAVAFVASLLPAAAARRIDPMVALRAE